MIQCKTCGCWPKGNECHLCNIKLVPVEEKPKYRKIRVRSIKRAAEERMYLLRSRAYLKINIRCAVFPDLRSNQVHHIKGRIGDLLLNEDFWLSVSQAGHNEINNNPQWAFDNGFSISRI